MSVLILVILPLTIWNLMVLFTDNLKYSNSEKDKEKCIHAPGPAVESLLISGIESVVCDKYEYVRVACDQ